MFGNFKRSLDKIKYKLFGPRLSRTQYKTERNITRPPRAGIGEGDLDIKFSRVDSNGIIEKENKPQARQQPKVQKTQMRDFTYFDCPDLNATFSITGIRNGTIHVICTDEIGTPHNIKIEGVFDQSGNPGVYGIVIRKPERDSANKVKHKILGYIDLGDYVGIKANAVMAIEDIIRDSVSGIKSGRNKVPQEVLAKIAVPTSV